MEKVKNKKKRRGVSQWLLWIQDTVYCVLDTMYTGYWILDTMDTGYWILDTMDTGYWIVDTAYP